ncbi:MAG: hypothetical protein GY847_38445, partial [Proteobacteria bacterium]|nr:hypothetical protein [Pseudomonadota bacterium]
LLTKKYNPGPGDIIDLPVWKNVYRKACHTEWNNTVLNLEKKVRSGWSQQVMDMFAHSDIPFSLGAEWCGYLYLNGIIDSETRVDENGESLEICRFASPFIQERLYNSLMRDLMGERTPILALEPLDGLEDVFEEPALDLPALMERYKSYLKRLKTKGLNPWKDQPRRADMHLTEAVGHFHLYAWLQAAIGKRCVISPEFPTGNGRVDLHVRCVEKRGIIEVKSFTDLSEAIKARGQAADYGRNLGLDAVTIALFVPSDDEAVLEKLAVEETIDGVRVAVSPIGWT